VGVVDVVRDGVFVINSSRKIANYFELSWRLGVGCEAAKVTAERQTIAEPKKKRGEDLGESLRKK